MKVIAFNGSPRKDGNTAALLHHVMAEMKTEGIDCEFFQLGGKNIHGCRGCLKCFENKNQRCSLNDDIANDCIEKIISADGILLGSPTYFVNVSSEMKALIDRAGLVAKANNDLFRRKVGAAVVAARRAGSVHVFDAINHFFLINQMIIPGSIYWNMAIGFDKGDVEKDQEGVMTMKTLGANMAWLLKKVKD